MSDPTFNFLNPAGDPKQLTKNVRFTRNVMPLLVMCLVVVSEYILYHNTVKGILWFRLLFYGVCGPLATYFTLSWILEGIRVRAEAEAEQARLYQELDTVQSLIKRLAEASGLEDVLHVALQGMVHATGAIQGMLVLPTGICRTWSQGKLSSEPPENWSTAIPAALSCAGNTLFSPLSSSGDVLGGVVLQFAHTPTSEQKALTEALSGEVATAIAAVQQRTRDLMTLYQVDESIRAERNMNRLLESVLGHMAQQSGAQGQAVYLLDQDGVLRLVWAKTFDGTQHQGGAVSGFAKSVLQHKKPLTCHSLPEDALFDSCQYALGLPMQDGEKLAGVLVLVFEEPEELEARSIQLLGLMANQATLAVRNARAYLYSEELAINEERNRIAREIHDGVAQSLAFTAIKMDVVERLLSKDPEKALSELQFAKSTLREQIKEIRRSIFALRPIDLERYGLLETIRRYVKDFGEQHNITMTFQVAGEIHLAPSDEALMFRILQESLNNVAKHSGAKHVVVQLCSGDRVELIVMDDGQGFDPRLVGDRITTAGGLGLKQMQERLALRGGEYILQSELGRGTRVHVALPQT